MIRARICKDKREQEKWPKKSGQEVRDESRMLSSGDQITEGLEHLDEVFNMHPKGPGSH